MKKKFRTAQQSLLKTKKIVRVYNHENVNNGAIKTVMLKGSINRVVDAMKDYTGRILNEMNIVLNKKDADIASVKEALSKFIKLNESQSWQE